MKCEMTSLEKPICYIVKKAACAFAPQTNVRRKLSLGCAKSIMFADKPDNESYMSQVNDKGNNFVKLQMICQSAPLPL